MRTLLVAGLIAASLLATPCWSRAQPGDIPLNSITAREHDGPQGATEQRASVQALQQTLTELQQLQLQLKQAHWNVSGSIFYSLHLMLQEHYEGTAKWADQVAERLQGIGVSSDGRATTIVRTSRVPEIPGGFIDDAQVLLWFSKYYRTVSQEIGAGIKATNDSDPTTSNLLQSVQHDIDKYQWQMRAHLQSTPTDPNTGADLNNGRAVAPVGTPTSPAR